MSEYTPTTEVVRHAVAFERERLGEPRPIKPEAFNRWLKQVKAEAWEEGYSASESEWMHTLDGPPVPEGEKCPECSKGNPYRQDNS